MIAQAFEQVTLIEKYHGLSDTAARTWQPCQQFEGAYRPRVLDMRIAQHHQVWDDDSERSYQYALKLSAGAHYYL